MGARRPTSSTAPRSIPKWEIVNPTPANLAVGGGNLTLTSAPGDVSGANFTARNILLQAVPQGPWTVTAKLDPTAIASNGQAAGVVLYGSQSPNYLAKTAIQYKTTDLTGQPVNGIWAERILTTNGTINGAYGGQYPNTGKLTPTGNAIWLRASNDGTNVSFTYSLDGTTFPTTAPSVPTAQFGAERDHQDRPVRQARQRWPARGGEVRLVRGRGAELRWPGHLARRGRPTCSTPAAPNGDGGCYDTDVKVTLNATDNAGGSGVDQTEYREQGPRTGPRTALRSTSPPPARTRSSTARSTRRAMSSRPGR